KSSCGRSAGGGSDWTLDRDSFPNDQILGPERTERVRQRQWPVRSSQGVAEGVRRRTTRLRWIPTTAPLHASNADAFSIFVGCRKCADLLMALKDRCPFGVRRAGHRKPLTPSSAACVFALNPITIETNASNDDLIVLTHPKITDNPKNPLLIWRD